jgi:hypothetical protein
MALLACRGFPVGPVGHDAGEHAFPFPVGLVHGPVTGRQHLVTGGPLGAAGPAGSCGLGIGPDRGHAGFLAAGAHLAELVAEPHGAQAVSVG